MMAAAAVEPGIGHNNPPRDEEVDHDILAATKIAAREAARLAVWLYGIEQGESAINQPTRGPPKMSVARHTAQFALVYGLGLPRDEVAVAIKRHRSSLDNAILQVEDWREAGADEARFVDLFCSMLRARMAWLSQEDPRVEALRVRAARLLAERRR